MLITKLYFNEFTKIKCKYIFILKIYFLFFILHLFFTKVSFRCHIKTVLNDKTILFFFLEICLAPQP